MNIYLAKRLSPSYSQCTMSSALFFQFFDKESFTYSYLIADPETKEAALIDTVLELVDRDLTFVSELDLKLKYVLDTHLHADHITGAATIRTRTGAQTAISSAAEVTCADILLKDGMLLTLGKKTIQILATPGHTHSCISFYFEGRVFTGDALLIHGNGRTDFQQGSAERLYDSIQNKLYTLPDETLVYPAHDYQGRTSSTIGLEKQFNLRIPQRQTKNAFVQLMSELKLEHPKQIQIALPANLACGQIQGPT